MQTGGSALIPIASQCLLITEEGCLIGIQFPLLELQVQGMKLSLEAAACAVQASVSRA